MPLLDKIFSKKIIIWLSIIFILIICLFYGIGLIDNYLKEKELSLKREAFVSSIALNNLNDAMEVWPEVFTYYRDNDEFSNEFSNLLFEVYSDYYINVYKQNIESEDAFLICRNFNSFLKEESFDMVVSAIYDDYLYEKIDYRTFITAINDYYLFSLYQSPKIVELLDYAADLYNSRQSYMLGESNQRTADYDAALEFYKNVNPRDILYYPMALEKIDECILLIREQIKNGN